MPKIHSYIYLALNLAKKQEEEINNIDLHEFKRNSKEESTLSNKQIECSSDEQVTL